MPDPAEGRSLSDRSTPPLVHPLLGVISGMCSDEAPHAEIDQYVLAAKNSAHLVEMERDRLRAENERLRETLKRIALQGGGRWNGERMTTIGNTGEEWVHWEALAQRALAFDDKDLGPEEGTNG